MEKITQDGVKLVKNILISNVHPKSLLNLVWINLKLIVLLY